ncbi:hypothetical protein [Malikia spinosa]|uniref:Electron transfer flavoprotein alpha/beta-subunit N-terminal domain-containing protein n=1 Tax=Malikia spinosa TaxID=86180 RepID=A0A7C9JLN2_9BURK|nr:hypothetical protein [Malikia spinosa]MYZ52286.1 hypothetical protein [Malikia spinosa]
MLSLHEVMPHLRSDIYFLKFSNKKNDAGEKNMTVLVVAEHDSTSFKSATLHAVTAGSELFLLGSGEVHLLVVGQQAADAAIAATQVAGVARVIYAEGESLAHEMVDNVAVQVLVVARHCSHILLPATAWGELIAARVAALLDVALVSNVSGIFSLDAFERINESGHTFMIRRNCDAIKVLTVRTNDFHAAGQWGAATIEGVKAIENPLAMISKFSGNRVTIGMDVSLCTG